VRKHNKKLLSTEKPNFSFQKLYDDIVVIFLKAKFYFIKTYASLW